MVVKSIVSLAQENGYAPEHISARWLNINSVLNLMYNWDEFKGSMDNEIRRAFLSCKKESKERSIYELRKEVAYVDKLKSNISVPEKFSEIKQKISELISVMSKSILI